LSKYLHLQLAIQITYFMMPRLFFRFLGVFFFTISLGFAQPDSLISHTAWVKNLPIFKAQAPTGEYRLPIKDFEFRIRVAGFANHGANIILLHGFPESSMMWETMLHQCAQAGYRVVAFDQRGYSPGARPSQVADYQLDTLSEDVIAVADALGFKKFHLVGHDWGAVVGWLTTIRYPQRVRTWSALSIPHLGVFFKNVKQDPEQQKRSAYFTLMQTPELPEKMFLTNNQAGLKKMLARLPAAHLAEYTRIFADSGAFTAAVNWYRAMDIEQFVRQKTYEKPIFVPTLFVWGKQDGVLNPAIIPQQKEWLKADYQELSLDCGHNLMQDQTEAVIAAVLARIKKRRR
jgi:pimeloyl-ACP methyl ester carboxylesterase